MKQSNTHTFKYLPVKRLIIGKYVFFRNQGEEAWFDSWLTCINKRKQSFIGNHIPFFKTFVKMYLRWNMGWWNYLKNRKKIDFEKLESLNPNDLRHQVTLWPFYII